MIEARFDDLSGAGTSFRLVGPVGLVEARRPEEVAEVLAAAESSARRGLWVGGFVAYEAAAGLEPTLAVRARAPDDPFAELPLAWFAFFEGREHTTLSEPRDSGDSAADTWRPSVDRGRYDAAIAAIRERIAAGDTYQVNYTLRLRSTVAGDERGLYRDMCFAQRGAHAAYLNAGRFRICSASPELFFELHEGRLRTRPMKGTAPRGRWPSEDEQIAQRLTASAKDRAENAMIVDLLRNDLGRVSRPGSVSWSEVAAERYETVWQLTSTVTSQIEPGAGLREVFAALFPSGSVTGAPKVRSMEIIAALEDSPRGVYCGAVGVLSPPGQGPDATFNVAIRTVTVDSQSGVAEYGVGGGITWDSRAGDEYEETVAKARILTARRPGFELLETLLHEPGSGLRHLDLHLVRLRSSAAYFGFACDETAVIAALWRAAASVPDAPARVRLLLDRAGKITTGAVPLPSRDEPVVLEVDDVPVDPSDVLLFHKTSRRGRYEEARARHPDADDVLLINTRGEVTESTIANLAVLLDGRWVTPPLDAGLLPGTERAALLAEGALEEAGIRPQELRRAEELRLMSATGPWRPAFLG
ncbi:MAG: aminodeoxychorismate synthase component I [Actinobacteria bacterium]|nr:aminodeoxychorismate synthase component I [Actinomycetota bacterium]